MKIHYIYHIPERNKIGVSTDVEHRMIEHGWTGDYQVIDSRNNPQDAGDREWELQDEHGYPRDKVHYAITYANRSKAGQAGGGSQTATDLLVEWNKNGLTPEQRKKANESFKKSYREGKHKPNGTLLRTTCQYCGREGQLAGMQNHIRSCKRKDLVQHNHKESS